MPVPQQPAEQDLDTIQHPLYGTLKFPKTMPGDQRNQIIDKLAPAGSPAGGPPIPAAHPEANLQPSSASDTFLGGARNIASRVGSNIGAMAKPLMQSPAKTLEGIASAQGSQMRGEKQPDLTSNFSSTYAKDKPLAFENLAGDVGTGALMGGAAKLVPAAVDAIPRTGRAAANLADIENAAQNVPVSMTSTTPALGKFKQSVATGGKNASVMTKLGNRMEPPSAPINFPEARDFYSNISRATAKPGMLRRAIESPGAPAFRYNAGGVRQALNSDLVDAANSIGRGEDYTGAMNEFRRGSQLNSIAKKAAIGAGAGAIGYSNFNKLKNLIPLLLLFVATACFGQAVRYNGDVYTINASAPLPGALYPVLASTSATINICTAPATGFTVLNAATQSISNGCTNYATTYNNAAQSSVCAPPTQLTRTSSTTCVKTVDAEGGFGVWLLSGTYQYTITLSYGSFGPYDFSVGGGGGGPPPPSNCGSLVGDVTSTNCGFGNLVGNTAMKVSTFGFTNVIGNNQSTSQTAVGTNNINRDQGEENIAVGDSNLNNTQNSSTSNGNNIAIGQQNGTEYYGTTAICLGFQNCDSGGNTSGGNALFDVVGIGSGAADNLGLGGFSIIGIGKNAVQNGVGYTGDMLEMICMGDQACFNPFFTGAQEADDIIGLGDSAASGFGAGSSNIVAIGDGADKQCIHAPCTPLPVPAQVLSLVAIGDTAASYNQGSSVVAVGSGALGSNTTGAGLGFYNQGNFNTAVGVNALVGNSTGAHNTAFGNLAGADGFVAPGTFGNSNHTGSNNTWVGDDSGPNTTTQLSNTAAFGYHAHNTASNQIVLGNSTMTQAFLFGTGDGCLSSSSGLVTGSGVACGSGGGGSAFSALTGSTNTTATMVVGSGATLSTTGTGTIAATSVGGITITGTPSVGQVPTATSSSAATWQNASTTPAFSAITSGTNTAAAMLVGTGASLAPTGAGTIAATSAVALASVPSVCSTGQYASGVDINGDAICVPLPTQPASQYIAPQAMSGCGVEYVTGLQYTIGACTYSINGVIYDSPLTNVTLAAADPSNPRIDVIFVDTTQTVQTITGVPAVSPQQPVVDPSTQLELTFVLVPAAATTPGNTTLVDIYLEGVEWTGAKGGTNGTRVNLTSTSNPYSGTHDTEFGVGGTVTTTTFAGYTVPSAGTVDLSNYNTLTLYARNKAAWPSTRSITVQWFNGSTAKGTAVVVSNGAFGFDAVTNVSSYQQISIPTSIFGIAGVPVTSVRFTVSGTGAALTGFYLDQITLQGGSGGPSLPATLMNFKGPWSSTATYNPNDTVTSGGVGYVALTTNTNQVVSNVAFWTPLGGSGGGGGITSFTANPSFWPSWLIPTVTGGSGPATSLTVGAGLVPIANGGTGTSTPGLVAGTNITISGTWPNQTINSTGGGGGGNTTSTSLTNNFLPMANGTNSIIDSHLQDTGSQLSYTGSGTVNSIGFTEGTAATGAASTDIFYALASTHRWTMNNNNAGALTVVGIGSAGTANDCLKLAANGIDIVDTGAVCGSGSGNVTAGGTLTSNAIILGAGTTAVAALGSLGTTTTVLHGNASGAPSFAVVTPSDATGNTSGSGNFVLVTSPTLVTPALGAATATSLLASGNVDGTAPVTITTGTTGSIGGTFKSGYTFNQEATAATAVAYTLPTAAAGLQYCVGNSWNGSAATTGVLTVNTSASGQFIIFTDGTLSATGGNVTSGGAAADAACFVGVDSTHWQQYTQRGTWTKH